MKAVWIAAFWICLGAPGAAQVLDDGRGFEDGCDRPAPPPFSKIVTSDQGPVGAARYFDATTAYGHAVLGDGVEASGLLVRYDDGVHVICDTVTAGSDRVFEDTSPRLADLAGDGLNEVLAVASHAKQGARLEIYGYPGPGQDFQLRAATPYIGTPFRWLAPVGAADLDGDGHVELAYVARPHLARTLRIWRYIDGSLTQIATQPGFTNHKIGWPFIAGGLRDCGTGPELILATADWSSLVAVRLQSGRITSRDLGPFEDAENMADSMVCD